MNEFISEFGIDWKLFLSQLVNFGIILIVLWFFVYKPVLKVLKDRNKKIKEGLDKADEADVRLKEIDVIGKGKIKEAETASINIIKATENKAKVLGEVLQKKLEENQLKMQKDLQESYKRQEEQAKELVLKNAVLLVKRTIIKTVELKPEAVDDALIKKAVEGIKHE
ncbi:MAG: ATP synthase F0 subunit B [Candidatus Staskawiczbacteria bacterium]|nr:ATP synthase F0 subunit B [Candidatus Staskawiczbacteria bacterium]